MRNLKNTLAMAVIMAGAVVLTARPASAATARMVCSIDEIVSVIDALCPDGGTASNIRQTADGCSFSLSCN